MLQILSMSVKAFGENIRRIRNDKSFSLKKVEAQSGGRITGAYVNQIENGLVAVEDISLGKLIGLAKGLQISFDELMFEALGKDFGKNSFINKLDSFLIPVEYWSAEDKKLFLKYIQIFISGMSATSHNRANSWVLKPDPIVFLSSGHKLSESEQNLLEKPKDSEENLPDQELIGKDVIDLENPRLYKIAGSPSDEESKATVQGLQGFIKPKKQMIPILPPAGEGDSKKQ